MSVFGEEIEKLQLRIVELEKQQQIEKETLDKNSIPRNFTIITDLLNQRKPHIENGIAVYPKNSHRDMINKNELVIQIEAIYNVLQILDARISKIENTK
jgi:hypothetical protein